MIKSLDKLLRPAAFVLVAFSFLLLYFIQPAFFRRFSAALEDSKFSVRHLLGLSPEAHKDILVVTIDEQSVNKFGRWPWDRKVTGDLISRLKDADIVALDIVFSETTTPEEDRYLADRIADAGNVIGGFFFRSRATETITEEALSSLEDCAVVRVEMLSDGTDLEEFYYSEVNIPEVSGETLSCAFFNIFPDVDGLFRHYPLAYIYKGDIFPSLAMQTMRNYLNEDIEIKLDQNGIHEFKLGDFRITDKNYLTINYYPAVRQISAVDVIKGNIPSSFFKDKIILIGSTEMGVYDMRATPVDPVMPGVFIHYTALSNFLKKEFLHSSTPADIALIVVSLLITAIVSLGSGIFRRMPLYIGIFIADFVAVNTLFIRNLLWIHLTIPILSSLLLAIVLEIITFVKAGAQAAGVKKAFSSYVSPEVVKHIVNNPDNLKLGGEEREVTVLFSDIRGFSSISETLPPHRLVYLLNRIFDPMTEAIINNRGLLDKYIGDEIMAIFNAPVDVENHPEMACRAALEMMGKLNEVNGIFRKEELPVIDMGIGINTGPATVGNMGSGLRFDYTAIGDTVNLASRLEGMNKEYRTDIIVSSIVTEKCRNFLFRKIDKVRVKGRAAPEIIYELMEDSKRNRRITAGFEEGLDYYFKKEYKKAKAIFEELHEEYNDRPSSVFAERCRLFPVDRRRSNWDGVFDHYGK